tara:strand:+ start:161 stop:358 length:198 start_codon:yes stop_codon:yes gene_type:complete
LNSNSFLAQASAAASLRNRNPNLKRQLLYKMKLEKPDLHIEYITRNIVFLKEEIILLDIEKFQLI